MCVFLLGLCARLNFIQYRKPLGAVEITFAYAALVNITFVLLGRWYVCEQLNMHHVFTAYMCVFISEKFLYNIKKRILAYASQMGYAVCESFLLALTGV